MSDTPITVAEINTAIRAILTTGQSYSIGGRSFTRADLGDLKELRTEVKAESAASSGKRTFVGDFSRTSGGCSGSELDCCD